MKYGTLGVLIACLFVRLAFWENQKEKIRALCVSQEIGFTGLLQRKSIKNWELDTPSIGNIGVDIPEEAAKKLVGHEILSYGKLKCHIGYRNPGRLSDGFSLLQSPRLKVSERWTMLSGSKVSWFSLASESFKMGLEKIFKGHPGILAFERAVWTGSTEGMPEELTSFYKEGGLLQILALSGQHVAALVLVLGIFLKPLCFRLLPNFYRYLLRFLPVFCCLVLLVTSGGNPPVLRTLGMLLSVLLLRTRNLHVSTFQAVLSSVAVLVVIDPSLLSNPSFFLSATATALLMRVSLGSYIWVSVLMPILVLPFSAFFFSKAAFTAPLSQLLIGWVWDLFLIPGGFLLLPITCVFPTMMRRPFLNLLETFWTGFCRLHSFLDGFVAQGYKSVIRPNLLELFILEFCLLAVASEAMQRPFFKKTDPRRIG